MCSSHSSWIASLLPPPPPTPISCDSPVRTYSGKFPLICQQHSSPFCLNYDSKVCASKLTPRYFVLHVSHRLGVCVCAHVHACVCFTLMFWISSLDPVVSGGSRASGTSFDVFSHSHWTRYILEDWLITFMRILYLIDCLLKIIILQKFSNWKFKSNSNTTLGSNFTVRLNVWLLR